MIATPSDEIRQELIAAWPTLPAEQRALWLRVLGSLLPPDAELRAQLEQLEDARYLDSLTPEDRQAAPITKTARELGYAPS